MRTHFAGSTWRPVDGPVVVEFSGVAYMNVLVAMRAVPSFVSFDFVLVMNIL